MTPEERKEFKERIETQWRDNLISGPDEWADACLRKYDDGFAAGAIQEREECAKIAAGSASHPLSSGKQGEPLAAIVFHIAERIRARGKEKP